MKLRHAHCQVQSSTVKSGHLVESIRLMCACKSRCSVRHEDEKRICTGCEGDGSYEADRVWPVHAKSLRGVRPHAEKRVYTGCEEDGSCEANRVWPVHAKADAVLA